MSKTSLSAQHVKWKAWVGEIQNIRYGNDRLDKFFDMITCFDVTEHLPREVYRKGIKEIYRVIKPRGFLILMQGNTLRPEHINILSEDQLVADFCSAGFQLVKHLPHRHHLLTKPK